MFIHSMYDSLNLLIPDSQTIPPPPSLLVGIHKSVLFCFDFSCLAILVRNGAVKLFPYVFP